MAATSLAAWMISALAVAGKAVLEGTDVYLFLVGMMLLAELARREGLFDWLAALAVKRSRGSPGRLFVLIYLVGTLVTIFLSNDATAVVLTPAVCAAAKKAKAEPLPYLFVCAFIANAASFVLPISNPANLVVYGAHLPSLARWLAEFGPASIVSVLATFAVLRWTQRPSLTRDILEDIEVPVLSREGRVAAWGIGSTGVVLMISSALGWAVGLPTFSAGLICACVILVLNRMPPWEIAKNISWSVLPLVAGLFVLVEAVEKTGLWRPMMKWLTTNAVAEPKATGFIMGSLVAVLSNVINNLPMGLLAGTLSTDAHVTPHVTGALLIGVDLGPNLSVTGSLATLLWLTALRREGQTVSAWQFLKLGCLVMPPALLAALAIYLGFNPL